MPEAHPHVSDLFSRKKLTLIAGPCVAESLDLCLQVAKFVQERTAALGISYIFKASFDKANRTSVSSYRGPGMQEGLEILKKVREQLGVPVLTDVHDVEQAKTAGAVVDVIQIPAFLCRQTDLIAAAASTKCPTNIKKGQFLAPEDIVHAVRKHREAGGGPVSVTERGVTFGYHNLVVDMRGLITMREVSNAAVVFDATHSVQRPSAGDGVTGGDRTMAPVLARAAVAVGVDGIFAEVHPNPAQAKSDGPNSLDFALLDTMLKQISALDATRRQVGW